MQIGLEKKEQEDLPELLEPEGSSKTTLTRNEVDKLSRRYDSTSEPYDPERGLEEIFLGDGGHVYRLIPWDSDGDLYEAECLGVLKSEYDRIMREAGEVFDEENPFSVLVDFLRSDQRAYWSSEMQNATKKDYALREDFFDSRSAEKTKNKALEQADSELSVPAERDWSRIDKKEGKQFDQNLALTVKPSKSL